MKDAIEMKNGGIKCDNPYCNFRDDSAKVEDCKQWLNKPCPKCGQNLLTEKDYLNTLLLIGMTKIINNIFPEVDDDEKISTMAVEMNGTGEIKFDTKK